VQKNAVSVQSVLQAAIQDLLGHQIEIKGCSRTDSGAHANEYFVGFKTPHVISGENLVKALNARLPGDIVVKNYEEKPPDFHARYAVKTKEYIYKLSNQRFCDPFLDGLVYFCKGDPNPVKLNNLATCFVGEHDFKSLSAQGSGGMNTIREIYYFEVSKTAEMLLFRVSGNGFLYKMVRIMIGTLIEFARNKKNEQDILNLLASGKRSGASRVVPACGLYLNKVIY
jgi:tRNA pseudouridine38-40 synthase